MININDIPEFGSKKTETETKKKNAIDTSKLKGVTTGNKNTETSKTDTIDILKKQDTDTGTSSVIKNPSDTARMNGFQTEISPAEKSNLLNKMNNATSTTDALSAFKENGSASSSEKIGAGRAFNTRTESGAIVNPSDTARRNGYQSKANITDNLTLAKNKEQAKSETADIVKDIFAPGKDIGQTINALKENINTRKTGRIESAEEVDNKVEQKIYDKSPTAVKAVIEGTDRIASRLVTGVTSGVMETLKAIDASSYGYSNMFAKSGNPIKNFLEGYNYALISDDTDMAKSMNQFNEDVAKNEKRLEEKYGKEGNASRLVGEAIQAIGAMAPTYYATFVGGTIAPDAGVKILGKTLGAGNLASMAQMFGNAFASYSENALNTMIESNKEGKTDYSQDDMTVRAGIAGFLGGINEAVGEYAFGGLNGRGPGIVDSFLEKRGLNVLGKAAKNNPYLYAGLKRIGGIIGEGLEEMEQGAVEYAIEKFVYNPDTEFDWTEWAESGIVGSLMSVLGSPMQGVKDIKITKQSVNAVKAAMAEANNIKSESDAESIIAYLTLITESNEQYAKELENSGADEIVINSIKWADGKFVDIAKTVQENYQKIIAANTTGETVKSEEQQTVENIDTEIANEHDSVNVASATNDGATVVTDLAKYIQEDGGVDVNTAVEVAQIIRDVQTGKKVKLSDKAYNSIKKEAINGILTSNIKAGIFDDVSIDTSSVSAMEKSLNAVSDRFASLRTKAERDTAIDTAIASANADKANNSIEYGGKRFSRSEFIATYFDEYGNTAEEVFDKILAEQKELNRMRSILVYDGNEYTEEQFVNTFSEQYGVEGARDIFRTSLEKQVSERERAYQDKISNIGRTDINDNANDIVYEKPAEATVTIDGNQYTRAEFYDKYGRSLGRDASDKLFKQISSENISDNGTVSENTSEETVEIAGIGNLNRQQFYERFGNGADHVTINSIFDSIRNKQNDVETTDTNTTSPASDNMDVLMNQNTEEKTETVSETKSDNTVTEEQANAEKEKAKEELKNALFNDVLKKQENKANENGKSEKSESKYGLERNEFSGYVSDDTVDLLDTIGEQLGVSFVITDKLKGGAVGFYGKDKETGLKTIYISAEVAKMNGDDFVKWDIGHEITHDIKKADTKLYNRLVSLVKEYYGEEKFNSLKEEVREKYSAFNEEAENNEMQKEELNDSVIEEEVVANFCGFTMFGNKEFTQKLIDESNAIGADTGNLIKTIIKKIDSMLKALKQMRSKGQNVHGSIDTLNAAREAFSGLYKESVAEKNRNESDISSEGRYSVRVNGENYGSDSNSYVLKQLKDIVEIPENIRTLSKTNTSKFDNWLRENAYDSAKNPDGKYEITYRTMQVIDGNLYPPMATIDTNGERGSNSALFNWEAAVADREEEVRNLLDSTIKGRAEWKKTNKSPSFKPDGFVNKMKKEEYKESTGLKGKALNESFSQYVKGIEEQNTSAWNKWASNPDALQNLYDEGYKPYYELVKEPGDTLFARYNPWLHSSNQIINDQFTGAYDRENLKVVMCIVPHSENTVRTESKYAKDPTGWTEWKSGDVASQILHNGGEQRNVFLSRWIMPVRVLDNAEVAKMYAGYINETNNPSKIVVPANTVSPQLLSELEKIIPDNISYSLSAPSKDNPNGTYDGSYLDRLRKKINKKDTSEADRLRYTDMVRHAEEVESQRGNTSDSNGSLTVENGTITDAENAVDFGKYNIASEEDLQNSLKEFAKTKESEELGWVSDNIKEIAEETGKLFDFIDKVLQGDINYDDFRMKNPTITLDWRDGVEKPIVTWVRKNQEYKFDMSADLLCINNEGMETVLSSPTMVDVMMSMYEFTSDDYLRLYQVMRDMGFVVPCKGCFDAAARFKMLPSTAQEFVKLVNGVIDERNNDPEKFDKNVRKLKSKKKTIGGLPASASSKMNAIKIGVVGDNLTEHIKWTQLMSAEGQTKALADWGGIFRAWQRTGAGRAKDKLLPEPYIGQIVNSTTTIIAPYGEKTPSFRAIDVNTGTGLRRNSHSEYRPILVVDEMQFMRDAWIKGLQVFKYMKELDDVRLFGNMGVKFNMSTFPAFMSDGVAAGLDSNGDYAISEESVGAREFGYVDEKGKQHYDGYKGLEEAKKYVNKDCSLSSVAFSIPHLIKLMTDVPTPTNKSGTYGSLIPFHASGATEEQLAKQGLGKARAVVHGNFNEAFSDYDKGVTNFEDVQNDRYGEGYVVVAGKDSGKSAYGHKMEYPDAKVIRNENLGITIYSSQKALESYSGHKTSIEGKLYTLDSENNEIVHSLDIDYNNKVREIGGDTAYKDASDYYIDELRSIGIMPRFDFDVSEDAFLEMCRIANVDPYNPKLGWKGEGNSWNPCDAESCYSLWCDYGMTDPETGKYSPQLPVLNGKTSPTAFEDALPDNYIEIIKNGVERYSNRKSAEDKRVNEAIREYVNRSVAEKRMTREAADNIFANMEDGKLALGSSYNDSNNFNELYTVLDDGRIKPNNVKDLSTQDWNVVPYRSNLQDFRYAMRDSYTNTGAYESVTSDSRWSEFEKKYDAVFGQGEAKKMIKTVPQLQREADRMNQRDALHKQISDIKNLDAFFENANKAFSKYDAKIAQIDTVFKKQETKQRKTEEANHNLIYDTVKSAIGLSESAMQDEYENQMDILRNQNNVDTENAVKDAVKETREKDKVKYENALAKAIRIAKDKLHAKDIAKDSTVRKAINTVKQTNNAEAPAQPGDSYTDAMRYRDDRALEIARNQADNKQMQSELFTGIEPNGEMNFKRTDRVQDEEFDTHTNTMKALKPDREKQKVSAKDIGRKVYTAMVNDIQALDDFGKKMSDMGFGTTTTELSKLARNSRMTSTYVLDEALCDKNGNTIGDSFKNVFLCYDENGKFSYEMQAVLHDYMVHKHNIDRMSLKQRAQDEVTKYLDEHPWLRDTTASDYKERIHSNLEDRKIALEYIKKQEKANNTDNTEVFENKNGNPLTAEESKVRVAEYEQNQSWVIDKAEGIYKWWDTFMKAWAVGSLMTNEQYEDLKKKYPHYVPTYRVDQNFGSYVNRTSKSIAIPSAIRIAKGGNQEISWIQDSFAQNLTRIIKDSRLDDVMQAIVDVGMLDGNGELSDYVYCTANDIVGSKQTAERIDEYGEYVDTKKIGADNVISARLGDTMYSAHVSDYLFDGLNNLVGGDSTLSGIANVGRTITNPMKGFLTSFNPAFGIRNLARDIQTGMMNTTGLPTEFLAQYGDAIKQINSDSEEFRRFKALGGDSSSIYRNDMGIVERYDRTVGTRMKEVRDGMFAWMDTLETMSRFSEYLRVVKEGNYTDEARIKGIKASAEITTDFGRAGKYGRVINAFVPYWNAGIQGTDRFLRDIGVTEKKTWQEAAKNIGVKLTRGLIISALPEVMQYLIAHLLGKDDEILELTDYEKKAYWHIVNPFGDGVFKIPKAPLYGTLVGTPIRRAIEGMVYDIENPFEGYAEELAGEMNIPYAEDDAGNFDVIETFLSLFRDVAGAGNVIELKLNEDFKGSKIIPNEYKDFSTGMYASDEEIYDNNTSALAYAVSRITSKAGLNAEQVDYLIYSYLGDFYSGLNDLVSVGLIKGEQNILDTAKDNASRFTKIAYADESYSNRNSNEYYEMLDEINTKYMDEKTNNNRNGTSDEFYKNLKSAVKSQYGDAISDLNKAIKEAESKTEEEDLRDERNLLYKQAVDFYNDCINGVYGSNPNIYAQYVEYGDTVAKEMQNMEQYFEQYVIEDTFSAPASITDQYNKYNKYELTPDDKKRYKEIVKECYGNSMTAMINSDKYKKADGDKKAQLLEDARSDAMVEAKSIMIKELSKSRKNK